MVNKSTTVKLTLKITSFIVRSLLNIIFYILVVITITNVSKMAYEFTYQLYGPVAVDSAVNAKKTIVQIKKGDSSMDIAAKLKTLKVIKNRYSFYLKVKLQNSVIMPGTYEVYTDMTYDEILAIITDYSASIIKEEDTGTGDAEGGAAGTGSAAADTGGETTGTGGAD